MITLTHTFNATPEAIYTAWLTGEQHAAMTGAAATGTPEIGAAFSAWDNYITGKNVELVPNTKIVQTWRTTEFPEDAPDSSLIIELEATENGTQLTLTHDTIPEGQEDQYRKGWDEHYFQPMTAHFSGQ